VARGAVDHPTAVAEEIIVALQLDIVDVAHLVIVLEHMGAAALELLRPPGLVELLLLDHVERVREHLDIADMVEMRMRGDQDLDVLCGEAELFELPVDHVVPGLIRLQKIAHALHPVAQALPV
jgi:hypothetical protein